MSSPAELEQALRDLPKIGTLVKDRGYRQIWRFEFGGRAYYLKFYPKGGLRYTLRRLMRGSPAMMEFTRLQMMQKAQVPAPHVRAALMGFHINGRKGDAVVLDAIEPSVQLDHYLTDFQMKGEPIPNRIRLAQQIRQLVHQLGRANMGHSDLHLGNFILNNGQTFLLDGYAVRRLGLRMSDVLQLGHSVDTFATRTDLLRGWQLLGPGAKMPRRNPISGKLYQSVIDKIWGNNRYFGKLESAGYKGAFFKHTKFAKRWSVASKLTFTRQDWEAAFPKLLQQMNADTLTVIKRSASGDVLSGEVVLNGRPLQVVIKRPKRKYWSRFITEFFRGSRPRRAWKKAWQIIVRDMPTAWPLVIMEKTVFGYAVDTMIIYEHVPGPLLAKITPESMSACDRQTLFRRVGRLLRRIESFGYAHTDAKSSNWIVYEDPQTGPMPVVIDIDGISLFPGRGLGVKRLLRDLKEQPNRYTPADSLALREGYAPWSPDVVSKLGET